MATLTKLLAKTTKVVVTTGITVGVAGGAMFAAQEPVTKASCDALDKASEQLDADHCIKAVAIKLQNEKMCNDIKGERFSAEIDGKKVQLENPPKMECITQIAADTNNPSLCDQVEGVLVANTKIDCLYRVASQNRNPAACAAIGNDHQSRAGNSMDVKGCVAMVARMPNANGTAPATPTPSADEEQKDRCMALGGNGYNAQSKQCTCPAGAELQGTGDAAFCGCEVKPTGVLHALFGVGKSRWHRLRPGEECGWWTGLGGMGQGLNQNKRACYAGGGKGFEDSEGTCTCPSGAQWDEKEKLCRCGNGDKLKEGGFCSSQD